MKFSLRLNNDHPVEDYVTMARAAERAGFDQFWVSHDLFWRSSPVILTACAGATERIELGTCILNPYTIHPSEIAMLAATLDEASNGRFNLGISAGAGEFLKWVGIEQPKPLTATREAIHAINAILSGERAPDWQPEAYLRFPARRRVPIYLGATSPRMLRLAGEVADGALPLLFPPEHYRTVLPYIQEGAARAGRPIEDVDIAACIWCSLSDDREAAERVLKDKIAYYGHALGPFLQERLGLTQEELRPMEHAMQTEGNIERARSLVTPAMLRIGVAGIPDDLRSRLDTLVEMGARHLSFGPPLGPAPVSAIELIGREIIPHFRG